MTLVFSLRSWPETLFRWGKLNKQVMSLQMRGNFARSEAAMEGLIQTWLLPILPNLNLAESMGLLRIYQSYCQTLTWSPNGNLFWKQELQKAQAGIKPRDVLPGLQVIRDICNLPRIPVDSEGRCHCYYCEKHIKRAQRGTFFKLPRYFGEIVFCYKFL